MMTTNLTKQQEPAIRFLEPSVMNDNYSHGDPTNNYTDQTNVPAIVAILAGFGLTILCVGAFAGIVWVISTVIKFYTT